MNRKEKCRAVFVVLSFLIGLAGVTAMIYGGVQLYKVSRQDATNDGVLNVLNDFIKCKDVVNAVPAGDYDLDFIQKFVKHQCYANQILSKVSLGFAAAFVILALISAPCAFKKDMWFGFGLWTALAIGTTIVAGIVVAAQAVPVASQFVDCRNFDASTINAIQSAPFNAICVRGPEVNGVDNLHKHSALKWMCKLCTFYAGSLACIGSLLLLLIIKKCRCCNPNAAPCNQACGNRDNCPIRSCCARLRSRMCSRSHQPLASQAEEGVVSAPSFYDVSAGSESPSAAASEDAGAYHSYSVQ